MQWTLAFGCAGFLWGAAGLAYAQETTPTLGPTKTPTPTAEATAETTEASAATATRERAPFEPLTQEDLSVLTGNVQRPNGIAWFNNNLYTACTGDGTVYEINDTTGSTLTYIFGVQNAHTLYVESDDSNRLTLWVPDFQKNTLGEVTRNGVRDRAAGLRGPWGIAYLDEEAFLISELFGNTISIVERDGDVFPVVTGLMSPTGLARDEEFIYVANNGSTRRAIEWYPLDAVLDGEEPEGEILVSGLQNVTNLQLAYDGYLYFAFSLGTRGVVGRVDPDSCRENGGCTNDQIEFVVYTDIPAPLAGLTITPDLRLFVHTMFSPDIYWVQLESTPVRASN